MKVRLAYILMGLCLPALTLGFGNVVQWPVILKNQSTKPVTYRVTQTVGPNDALNFIGQSQGQIGPNAPSTQIIALNMATWKDRTHTNAFTIHFNFLKPRTFACKVIIVVRAEGTRVQMKDVVYTEPSACSVSWDANWYQSGSNIQKTVIGKPLSITINAPS